MSPRRVLASGARRRKAQPTLAEISETIPASLRSDKDAPYLAFYEDLFRALPREPRHILEIGVLQGGSLLLFAQRFPDARILGIDVNRPPAAFDAEVARLGLGDRLHVAIGSQADVGFLHAEIDDWFGTEPLDLVSDDASHLYELTRATFDAVFLSHVRPGGIYVVEDWGCGYWPRWDDGDADGQHGLPKLVKELVDLVALEDRTREWQGARALDVEEQMTSPVERAILTKGIAAFVRAGPTTR